MAKQVKVQKEMMMQKGGPNPFMGFYFMGFIGSAVYFVGNVDGFWNVILALLKAMVWPAFLINQVFETLGI